METEKRGRGRPRKTEGAEDLKQKYKDIKYSSTYYRTNKNRSVICENCKETVNKFTIRQHQRSHKCINKTEALKNEKIEDVKTEDVKTEDIKINNDIQSDDDDIVIKLIIKGKNKRSCNNF